MAEGMVKRNMEEQKDAQDEERRKEKGGVPIGSNGLTISHLQFVDDAMIFCKPNLENLRNVKRVLKCFKLVSRLNINFHKSGLMGVGVGSQMVRMAVNSINYRIGELPTVYLGFLLRTRHSSIRMWKHNFQKKNVEANH
ncbi:hypothetical protein QQP08_015198 [Theobroma cacao]|nr:hypothetical protein QQP08_015198 [Theobroma cacao]